MTNCWFLAKLCVNFSVMCLLTEVDTESSSEKKSRVVLKGKKKKTKGKEESFKGGSMMASSSRGFKSKLVDEGVAAAVQPVKKNSTEAESELDKTVTVSSKTTCLEQTDSESDSGTNSSRESDDGVGNDDCGGDGNSGTGNQGTTNKAKTAKKKRYILFLGNLPSTISKDDIISHFNKRGVPIAEFRLLTHKDSGKSKGCGFMELSSNAAMQNALKFHRSRLLGKHINVEVTCGGGGKGEGRRKRIQDKNRKLRLEKAAANPVKHKTVSK